MSNYWNFWLPVTQCHVPRLVGRASFKLIIWRNFWRGPICSKEVVHHHKYTSGALPGKVFMLGGKPWNFSKYRCLIVSLCHLSKSWASEPATARSCKTLAWPAPWANSQLVSSAAFQFHQSDAFSSPSALLLAARLLRLGLAILQIHFW